MLKEFVRLLAASTAAAAGPPESRRSDRFPNVALTDQFGRRARFRNSFLESGDAFVVNSMYTTCRGSCPGTTATLGRLRDRLAPVFGRRLTFLSFTLEPRIDTPDRLLDYASLYGADRRDRDKGDWLFLTGEEAAIEALRRGLGFYDLDPAVDRDLTQHASLLVVGNATTDRWAAVPAELRETTLVETVRRVAGFTFEQRYGIRP